MDRDDEIFADALDLPAAARAELLDRLCANDPGQRRRIEALLAGHDAAGNFLEKPAGAPPPLPDEEKPGDVIGRYLLLRKIGEGGCGAVYLAEQKMPVHRRVALKVIKLGMDTRAVIARFEAERQALALMDHPDIARVFDAGATGAGRPFFVMELVEGLPITKFCDEHRLTIPARLRLFARVCLALQHAHQKGIIHRDVKPSNILVTLRDGEPAPKVIDFGIAKATADRLTEQTLVTGVDQFIGTPAYMSPEQADRRDGDIDTRSDVYALGIVCYELLTGRLPFDPKTLSRAGVDELRRIIREVKPARPSARIEVARASRPCSADDPESRAGRPCHDEPSVAVAAARGLTPKQLSSALRGDLDWIVMRCLEKVRDRRYGSARDLADDVLRHLRQEPVEARPPSAAYRLERFVARNRLMCASVAAIALALIVGTVVSVRQAVRATHAERIANAERDLAQAASRAEAAARTDAQRRQEQAEDLLAFMIGDFRTELQKIGRLSLLDAIGEKAMAYFAALKPEELTDTALARQAKALTQIGQIRLDQNRYADAHAAFTSAYTRAAALASRHPRDGDMLFERAQAEYWIGFVARRRGEYAVVREWFARYRDSAIALAAVEGKTARAQLEFVSSHHNLAVVEVDEGNYAAARVGFLAEEASLSEMLAGTPNNSQLLYLRAEAASWLGTVAERDGHFDDAVDQFGVMEARYRELTKLEPTVARWRLRLADSMVWGGVIRAVRGKLGEAADAFSRAENVFSELVARDPENRQWQVYLLNLHMEQIPLLLAQGHGDAAIQVARTARSRCAELLQGEPSSRVLTRCLATAWRLESELLVRAAQSNQADDAVQQALRLGEGLVGEDRANNRVVGENARAELLAGRIAAAGGRPAHAREHWERVLETVGPKITTSTDWRMLDPAAQAMVLLGRSDEARPLIERLRRSGYVPLDPLALPILGTASLLGSESPEP